MTACTRCLCSLGSLSESLLSRLSCLGFRCERSTPGTKACAFLALSWRFKMPACGDLEWVQSYLFSLVESFPGASAHKRCAVELRARQNAGLFPNQWAVSATSLRRNFCTRAHKPKPGSCRRTHMLLRGVHRCKSAYVTPLSASDGANAYCAVPNQ